MASQGICLTKPRVNSERVFRIWSTMVRELHKHYDKITALARLL